MISAPTAAPPITMNSLGWIRTGNGPPTIANPPSTAAKTTAKPTRVDMYYERTAARIQPVAFRGDPGGVSSAHNFTPMRPIAATVLHGVRRSTAREHLERVRGRPAAAKPANYTLTSSPR